MDGMCGKWRIDRFRVVLFLTENIKLAERQWFKHFTGTDVVSQIQQSSGSVQITPLSDGRHFYWSHNADQKMLDISWGFEQDRTMYHFLDIKGTLMDFQRVLADFYPQFQQDVIRIGYVLELSIRVENEKVGCDTLVGHIEQLNGLGHGLDEISLKLNRSYEFDELKINRIIQIANGQKLVLSFNPQLGMPTGGIENNIILNIDINTDAAHRQALDISKVSEQLYQQLVGILDNGGWYASNE